MRFYRDNSTKKIIMADVIKSALFIALLVIGLVLCPDGSLYNLDRNSIRYYSVGVFLSCLSIIYFCVSLAIKSRLKGTISKFFAVMLLIVCGIVSVVLVSSGGTSASAGVPIFCGVVIGTLTAFII